MVKRRTQQGTLPRNIAIDTCFVLVSGGVLWASLAGTFGDSFDQRLVRHALERRRGFAGITGRRFKRVVENRRGRCGESFQGW